MFHSLADSFPPRILIIVACLISSLMYKEEIQPKLCLLSKIVQIIPVPCPESLGLHLHLKRWAATEMVDYGCSWYTRHGNQLRWLSVCVCVILSYDWTNVVTGWNGNWLQCAVITMTITGLLIIYAQKVGTSSSVIGWCDSSMLQPAAISIS